MSMSPPPLPGHAPGKPPANWLQRNLKWLLPLLMLAIAAVWALAMWRGLRNMEGHMQRDAPVLQANERATSSAELKAMLGSPLRVTLLAVESKDQADTAAPAVYRFEVSGPEGRRRLVVAGQRVRKRWVYERFQIEQEGRLQLDLRTDEEKACGSLPRCH